MDVPKVADEVERRLNIELELRESSYLGGEYRSTTTELDEKVRVLNNSVEDEDGEVVHPEFGDHTTIMWIEKTTRADEFVEKLADMANLDLLERIVW